MDGDDWPWLGMPTREQMLACLNDNPAEPGWLLLIDVDHLKRLNDAQGQEAGHQVLITLGAVIRYARPIRGLAARVSGDEFAIWWPDATEAAAIGLAAELLAAVATRLAATQTTVSVGLAPRLPGDPHGLGVYDRADHAMGEAKNAGRARWQLETRAVFMGLGPDPRA